MKSRIKVSGVSHELPPIDSDPAKGWSFEARAGGWILATRKVDGGGMERRRFHYHRAGKRVSFSLEGPHRASFTGEWVPEVRGGSGGSGASDYTAQFPGKVRKISVREGDQVEEGGTLMMVEAMKMEFAVKASAPGRVSSILVKEGDQISPGQELIRIEGRS